MKSSSSPTTNTMQFSLSSRRKNLLIRVCLGANVCILLYLVAMQYWDQPASDPNQMSSPSKLFSDGKKRTLSSIDNVQQQHVNNQTLLPPPASTTLNVDNSEPIQCLEKDMRPRKAMRGQYWVFYNYVPAMKSFKCNQTLTYTTHCDHTFLDNLVPLLKRWQGPISVALYTPGSDYEDALKAVSYYR